MMNWERRFWLGQLGMTIVGLAIGQAVPATPTLSTADKVAIQTLEQKKADAQKMYNEANQQELLIEQEFSVAHKGFHINPQTFAIDKDEPKPVEPKK